MGLDDYYYCPVCRKDIYVDPTTFRAEAHFDPATGELCPQSSRNKLRWGERREYRRAHNKAVRANRRAKRIRDRNQRALEREKRRKAPKSRW